MENTTSTATADTTSAASTATTDTSTSTTTATTQESKAPTSFREAVYQLAAQDESASPDGTAATTAPQTQTAEAKDAPASKKGPIPFDVHQTALENARTKAVEAARPQIEQELRQQYAWAEPVQAEDRDELIGLYHSLKRDLIGTPVQLLWNALQSPQHSERARSELGRLFAALRGSKADTSIEDEEPQPDIQLEDGRAVYSAAQLATRDDYRERRLMAQFDQKLQPFKEDRERAQAVERQRETWNAAAQMLARYKDKPQFTEHKAEILALMERDPSLSLADAYNDVLTTKVLPSLSGKAKADLLADIHHKASAGTLNPQQTTTAAPFKPDGKFTGKARAFFEGAA